MSEQQDKITNLPEVVRQIRYRPEMYLGDNKISSMRQFLNGYTFALLVHKIKEDEAVSKNFHDFHAFTAKRLGMKVNGKSWEVMMTEKCKGNEIKALDLFFKIFEEFALNQKK